MIVRRAYLYYMLRCAGYSRRQARHISRSVFMSDAVLNGKKL